MDTYEKKCLQCGRAFYVSKKHSMRGYCSTECKIKAQKEHDLEYYNLFKQKPAVTKRQPKKKGPSITEIAVMARREHMTYGQYVAKHGL